MLYELATLSCPLLGDVADRAHGSVDDGAGELLGCWLTEWAHSAAFRTGSVVTALGFLPPIRTGDRGGVYEFRIYRLKPGGLAPTLKG